jgi:copper chaperone CopZ
MTTFAISGMTCIDCHRKVELAIKSLSSDAIVTLDPPQAKIRGVSPDKINDVLSRIGKYRVTPAAEPAVISKTLAPYYPLALVMGLIAIASSASGGWMGWMMNFMAGFYIVFGAFKLLDVPAFANAYARYDVVAKAFKPWGYAYPFVEVALGMAFLFGYNMITLSWIALILSAIGAVGVIKANLNKQTIQCACLGTVFKLPMSFITVIENVGMATMAAWMIWGM